MCGRGRLLPPGPLRSSSGAALLTSDESQPSGRADQYSRSSTKYPAFTAEPPPTVRPWGGHNLWVTTGMMALAGCPIKETTAPARWYGLLWANH